VKTTPILFDRWSVDAICERRKTMAMTLERDAVVITCDDVTGVTDKPCPYGEPGDRLSIHAIGHATNIILEVVRVRLLNLTYGVSDAEALAMGYESPGQMFAKEPFGQYADAEGFWVWACEFKVLGDK